MVVIEIVPLIRESRYIVDKNITIVIFAKANYKK